MAIGDKAAAKGLPVVAPTGKVNVGYENINAVADALADEMDRFRVTQSDPASAGTVADGIVWISWA